MLEEGRVEEGHGLGPPRGTHRGIFTVVGVRSPGCCLASNSKALLLCGEFHPWPVGKILEQPG